MKPPTNNSKQSTTYVVGNVSIDKTTGKATVSKPASSNKSASSTYVVGNVTINKATGDVTISPTPETKPTPTPTPAPTPTPTPKPQKPTNTITKIEDLKPTTGYTKVYIEEIKSTAYVYITNENEEVTFSIGQKDLHETVSTIAQNSIEAGINPTVVTNAGFAQMGDNKTEMHGALIVNGKELSTYQSVYGKENEYERLVASANTFVLWKDNTTEIMKITISDIDYLKQNAQWAIGAGYILVQDEKIMVTKDNKTVGNGWYIPNIFSPRTMFGVNDEGNFICVVIDGRGAGGSRGVTAYQQALIMKELGAVHAVNFDGGGSSTFWYNGLTRNHPSDGSEREIGNVMMIISK